MRWTSKPQHERGSLIPLAATGSGGTGGRKVPAGHSSRAEGAHYSHSIITMALQALPLLGFIRFTPRNTVTNTVSRRMLSIHAGFRAMTKN